MIRSVQQGLLEDGISVPVTKLCAWFGVPRRTVYYKPVKSPPKVDARFSEPIKALIEEEPSFGYRTVAWLLGFNSEDPNATGSSEWSEHRSAHLPDKGLAGAQAIHRSTTKDRSAAIGGQCPERTLVNRPGPHLGGKGPLGHAGAGHGLPHARTVGVASITVRKGNHGRLCT